MLFTTYIAYYLKDIMAKMPYGLFFPSWIDWIVQSVSKIIFQRRTTNDVRPGNMCCTSLDNFDFLLNKKHQGNEQMKKWIRNQTSQKISKTQPHQNKPRAATTLLYLCRLSVDVHTANTHTHTQRLNLSFLHTLS